MSSLDKTMSVSQFSASKGQSPRFDQTLSSIDSQSPSMKRRKNSQGGDTNTKAYVPQFRMPDKQSIGEHGSIAEEVEHTPNAPKDKPAGGVASGEPTSPSNAAVTSQAGLVSSSAENPMSAISALMQKNNISIH